MVVSVSPFQIMIGLAVLSVLIVAIKKRKWVLQYWVPILLVSTLVPLSIGSIAWGINHRRDVELADRAAAIHRIDDREAAATERRLRNEATLRAELPGQWRDLYHILVQQRDEQTDMFAVGLFVDRYFQDAPELPFAGWVRIMGAISLPDPPVKRGVVAAQHRDKLRSARKEELFKMFENSIVLLPPNRHEELQTQREAHFARAGLRCKTRHVTPDGTECVEWERALARGIAASE